MIIQHLCLQDTKNYKCQKQLNKSELQYNHFEHIYVLDILLVFYIVLLNHGSF